MCLTSLKITLLNYIMIINDAFITKEEINSKKLSVIIENGLTLTDLAKSANNMFGKILVLVYLIVILSIVNGTFLGLNVVKAFSTLEPGLILTSITGFTIACIGIITLRTYACIGQHLCEAYSVVNDRLSKVLMLDGICDKQRRELEFLVTRFSIRSPIRPLDMFDMNYANCAVLNNIMFTYTIILMQFKGY